MKTAIVTGITGQDGAYLTKFLLNKNYTVYGAARRLSTGNFWRIKYLGVKDDPNLHLVKLDITDLSKVIRAIQKIKPDEIYNLAANSFVQDSFESPVCASQINSIGVINILEAIRITNKKIFFYQASSSEMFGKVAEIPQTEKTPFYPRSPYAISKLYSHWMTINYRESYNIFAVSGILFNHESPLRGKEFVTRKITSGLARVKLGYKSHIELGNLDSKRDWGYAEDYIEGMWLMLQAENPDDYILSTGKTTKIRDFVGMACKYLDINIKWGGQGLEEYAIDCNSGNKIVKINPKFYRPTEVELLVGNSEKAKKALGWTAKMPLEDLCSLMVKEDLKRAKEGFDF